jgi:predicted HicB family RNase H-like nuclease
MSEEKSKVVYINEELHTRVKALAAQRKMSMKELIERVLDAHEKGQVLGG